MTLIDVSPVFTFIKTHAQQEVETFWRGEARGYTLEKDSLAQVLAYKNMEEHVADLPSHISQEEIEKVLPYLDYHGRNWTEGPDYCRAEVYRKTAALFRESANIPQVSQIVLDIQGKCDYFPHHYDMLHESHTKFYNHYAGYYSHKQPSKGAYSSIYSFDASFFRPEHTGAAIISYGYRPHKEVDKIQIILPRGTQVFLASEETVEGLGEKQPLCALYKFPDNTHFCLQTKYITPLKRGKEFLKMTPQEFEDTLSGKIAFSPDKSPSQEEVIAELLFAQE